MAAALGVTASTVSANLKKLARDGLIAYEPYGSIALSDAGRTVAVEIVRRHRIIETYLTERLGLTWDQVHDEANRLEHAVSDLVLDRMDEVLGHPTFDPHGDPIPARDGSVATVDSRLLTQVATGERVTVIRISDRHADVLRYLTDKRIALGTTLTVIHHSLAAGALVVTIGDDRRELTAEAAAHVRVVPADGGETEERDRPR